jgi:hypothetical protein
MRIIYGISDKTSSCPFYSDFFEKEVDALKQLEKQMDYAHIEFGLTKLKVEGDKVYHNDKVIFSVDKLKLK